jgi:aminotransferase
MPEIDGRLSNVYNHRLNEVEPSGIRQFDNLISDVPDIIKLTLGEPDLDTPQHIKEAAKYGIDCNDSHYAPQPGKMELRQAIADYLKSQWKLNYDPKNEVVVTNGATQAIFSVLETLVNPGDEILLPAPLYALYEPVITLLGGKIVWIDTTHNDFKLTPDALTQALNDHSNAKALILNYPNNPTGVEYTAAEIMALAKTIKQYGLWVVTDEIYVELNYTGEHLSLAQLLPQQTIYINGLSKSHAMTGWRLGYVCAPHQIIQKILTVNGFIVTCVSDVVQDAAIEAFRHGLLDASKFNQIYRQRRDLMVQHFKAMNIKFTYPAAAFYIWVKIPAAYGDNDYQFALDLAQRGGVGVVPGRMFGDSGCGYVRVSYSTSTERLLTALHRWNSFLQNNEIEMGNE